MLETYTRLFENLDVGILIANDAAIYMDANHAACRLYDRPRGEIVGHHLSEFIDGARQDEVDAQWRAFLRDGAQHGNFEIRLPAGRSQRIGFHAQANFAPGLHCSFITPGVDLENTENGSMLTICAWTKRILVGDQWLTLEEYFQRVHGLTVTHGICPAAFSSMRKPPLKR